jgi:hypothetical protein
MACIIAIKEELNNSIDKILGGYRDATHSYKEAQKRSSEINDRWSNLSKVEKFGDNIAKVDISDRVFEEVVTEALELQNQLDDELSSELDTSIEETKEVDELFEPNPETIVSETEEVEEEYAIQTAYKNELEKTGSKPKVILIKGTKAILNDNGTYDLIDPSNNFILQRYLNLDTMQIVEPIESLVPYDNKVYDDFVRNTMMHPYTEALLAEKGIDINDIFDDLGRITTELELNNIIGKILKNIC